MEKAITRKDVVEAYQLFLDRLPESEEAITSKVDAGSSKMQLWREFLECEEYKRVRFGSYFREGAPYVETACSNADAAEILQRVYAAWAKLGEEDPYWSVLTDDRFRSANAEQHLDSFYASGAYDSSLIDLYAANTGITVPRGACLELGAGVGRTTIHLAARFNEVRAWDISPGNLRLAERHLGERGISNVRFHRVRTLEDFAQAEAFDFFFSLIVLQHNPPPIQYRMLSYLLEKVRPNGHALFQTPSRLPHYKFSVKSYLSAPPSHEMEMHCLPIRDVLSLLQDKGFSTLDVVPDRMTGTEGSFTYFARRDRVPVIDNR